MLSRGDLHPNLNSDFAKKTKLRKRPTNLVWVFRLASIKSRVKKDPIEEKTPLTKDPSKKKDPAKEKTPLTTSLTTSRFFP